MRFHFGLYLLLTVVSSLAVVFAAMRAWGPLGLVPLIFAGLSFWMVHATMVVEREFDRAVLTFAAVTFALAAMASLGWMLIQMA
jgi:hypothetical protein